MQSKNESKLGNKLALSLFVSGFITLIFLYISPTWSGDIVDFLYGLTVALIVINVVYFGRLVFKIIKSKGDRKKLYRTCMVMLINVPFLASFAFVGVIIKSHLRITFTNSTEKVLTDVRLIGCEDYTIPKLNIGQSKTIWVEVQNDCAVSVVYEIEGQVAQEIVVGYATPGFGEKVKYTLVKKDNE